MANDAAVFIVDDDAAQRDSLRWLLESVGLAVEAFSIAEDFLAAYDGDRPGCLVADLRLPGMSGMTLLRELADRGISLPVIVITGYGDVPTAISAMKSGSFDFVEKPIRDNVLLDRVRQAIEVDRRRRQERNDRGKARERLRRLTDREREVMKLLVKSKSNKMISGELGISERTVETHRARLMKKMKAKSIAELVRADLLLKPQSSAKKTKS